MSDKDYCEGKPECAVLPGDAPCDCVPVPKDQFSTDLRVTLDITLHVPASAGELRELAAAICDTVKDGQIEIPMPIKDARWTKVAVSNPDFKWDA
jgi:hypothetical protein